MICALELMHAEIAGTLLAIVVCLFPFSFLFFFLQNKHVVADKREMHQFNKNWKAGKSFISLHKNLYLLKEKKY